VECDQGLVGCNDVLAIFQCLKNQFTGRIDAANQFDHDVNFGVVNNREGIRCQMDALNVADSGSSQISCGCGTDLDGSAGAAGNLTGISLQHTNGATAHGAKTE